MKTRNIKLATFGFAAMLLASCSDSNDTPTPNPTPAETGIIGKEVTSITDAQQLAARVYNFKRPSATRAAGVTSANLNQAYTMEAEPTGLDFAKMERMSNHKPWNFPANLMYPFTLLLKLNGFLKSNHALYSVSFASSSLNVASYR